MTQTILITGCSTGIGKATARHFQSNGWNVIATMRNPANERDLTGLPNVLVTRLDVHDENSIREAVALGVERFGAIDALCNNAGYGLHGVLEVVPLDKLRHQFETNVFGPVACMQAVLPHFRERKAGTIVNVTSAAGKLPFPFGAPYVASKFAVEGLTESAMFELEPIGIRVKLVEPGAIRTEFNNSLELLNDESLEEYQPTIQKVRGAAETVSGMASGPEVVAEVIWRAVTDGSDRLRYPAGADAEQFLGVRDTSDDATVHATWREVFNLQ